MKVLCSSSGEKLSYVGNHRYSSSTNLPNFFTSSPFTKVHFKICGSDFNFAYSFCTWIRTKSYQWLIRSTKSAKNAKYRPRWKSDQKEPWLIRGLMHSIATLIRSPHFYVESWFIYLTLVELKVLVRWQSKSFRAMFYT